MKEEKKAVPQEPTPESSPLIENKETFQPASRSTRIKAWIGVVAMVLLTIGYFYVFYSGQIINW